MARYEDFEDTRMKHLEFIQAVITRLGNNGFLVKGWALTITVALLGFSVNSTNWRLALVALGPSLLFWGVDAYFLQAERLYRELYKKVSRDPSKVEPFDMDASSADFWQTLPSEVAKGLKWRKTLWRPVLRNFYVALAGSAVLVALIVPSIEKPADKSAREKPADKSEPRNPGSNSKQRKPRRKSSTRTPTGIADSVSKVSLERLSHRPARGPYLAETVSSPPGHYVQM